MDDIDCGTGHVLSDNGVGDYDLKCSKTGEKYFVPYMLARLADTGTLGSCSLCGETLSASRPPEDDRRTKLLARLMAPGYPQFTWEDSARDICFELQDGTGYRGKFLFCSAFDGEQPHFILSVRTGITSSVNVPFDDPSLKRWWWPT